MMMTHWISWFTGAQGHGHSIISHRLVYQKVSVIGMYFHSLKSVEDIINVCLDLCLKLENHIFRHFCWIVALRNFLFPQNEMGI